jgi:Family of unknown function (DUF6228)
VSADIVIRSTDGVSSLEFAEPQLTSRNHFTCTATLEIEGELASIELSMITPYRNMWLDFFRDLADNTAGWEGQRQWSSEFEELTVGLVNDGDGLIQMTVTLWPERDDWNRNATLTINPADLQRVRDELPTFLGLSESR